MSITDELRTVAAKTEGANGRCERLYRGDLDHIADRIDEEYQKAIRELNNLADASVLLPVDADGEVIRIGDVMEGVDKYDSLKKVMGKVITVSFESNGAVGVAIQVWSSDGRSWHRAYLDPDASVYCHHHTPTVEDVLREFAVDVCDDPALTIRSGVVEEYASRLRLAGDGA